MELPGIGSWLTKRELMTPDKEAVIDGEKRITYKTLNQRVNRLCFELNRLGLKYGDRICVLSQNRLEFIETIMGCAKTGLILVPLNWRLTPDELLFAIKDSGATALFFDPDLKNLAQKISAQFAQCISFGEAKGAYEDLLRAQDDVEPEFAKQVSLSSPHIIMYTAGTTGKPKGAVLLQASAFFNALNLNIALDFSEKDRNLLTLPMFHIGGIGLFTLPMLYKGGTIVIQKTFDPLVSLNQFQNEKITLFFGVPAMFLAMIQHPEFNPEKFKSARVVMCGGAPLPTSLVLQYKSLGITLTQGFGMSEAGPSIATLYNENAIKKAGSVGRPVFHMDARIVDEVSTPLAPGQVGELVIKGPNLLKEYWNRPDATRESFTGEWFHTGDLAYADPEGDLYIVERKKDMFISGGENVYPAEVENILYEIEEISETAVIGVKDDKWGETGLAIVVLKPEKQIDPNDIIEHLGQKLAKFKIPKKIIFQDQLPRNAAGKVLKKELRRQFS